MKNSEAVSKPYERQNHYELLEVPVSSTAQEIRDAYQRALEIYGPDSAALYALGSPGEAGELRDLLRRAFEVLSDPERRREYDLTLGFEPTKTETAGAAPAIEAAAPQNLPSKVLESPSAQANRAQHVRALESAPEMAAEDAIANAEAAMAQVAARAKPIRPKPIEIPPDAELNGELLRRVRETMGLTLHQVSDRTRISVHHLDNVEADRYEALPALVYLRGILLSLAREYRLDPVRVSKGYLALIERLHPGLLKG